ncbi:MAG: hypothetical protein C0605_17675 [Hyphomicrobiales bacterium]|nr:MAG: hypothetical protein C0605_17675 [Hyphomicrobiales bacterium]
MSIITVATSKGGAGKTTVAQVIAGASCQRGLKVAAIDADYNHSLSDWANTFGTYPIEVHHEVNEANLVPLASDLEDKHDLVVIDTAGAAMQATVFAIGCADLVLVPSQLSSSDVIEAVKTMHLVASASQITKRKIEARIILTDYQPHTNIAEHSEGELRASSVPVMKTKLNRLVGFKEMTFNGEVPLTGVAGQHVVKLMFELEQMGVIPAQKMVRVS